MSKIEAVIFDAGGVLHESNSVVTDDLVQELGLEQETLQKIWANQIPLLGSGKIDEAEFWKQVSSEHGIRQVEVAENLLGRAFTEALKSHVPVIELIKELGTSGVKLAVLSNTIEPHAKALRDAGLYDGFDYLFLSHEVGMRKPDIAIYEHALAELGTKPEATIFVDDDPENVEAAEALGMKGLVFTDTKKVVAELRSLILDEN
jgi:epoxide hydrolase-like predicted phosphatase